MSLTFGNGKIKKKRTQRRRDAKMRKGIFCFVFFFNTSTMLDNKKDCAVGSFHDDTEKLTHTMKEIAMKTKFSKIMRFSITIGLSCAPVLFNHHAFSQTASANGSAWKITIASKDEPGEPMVVSGTVYAPDGKTPVEGITVHVYHTDAEGYYRKGDNSSSNPRLKGTMTTNAQGQYEYRTIKPAAYPGGGNPAHVHYVISGNGYSKQYDELQFEGDRWLKNPTLSPSQRSDNFLSVRPLTKDKDGVWRAVKDIKLK